MYEKLSLLTAPLSFALKGRLMHYCLLIGKKNDSCARHRRSRTDNPLPLDFGLIGEGMKKKEPVTFRTTIGGQALIEGILMRGPKKQAVALRTPDRLVVQEEELNLIGDRYPVLSCPLYAAASTS